MEDSLEEYELKADPLAPLVVHKKISATPQNNDSLIEVEKESVITTTEVPMIHVFND